MKKKINFFLAFTSFTLIHVNLFSQNNNEANTLLGNGNMIKKEQIGLFIAPNYNITQMDGSIASLVNLRCGINLKNKFSFGAYLNTSLNPIRPTSETIQNIYMDYWSTGGFVEYTLFSKNVVHMTFPIYVGYGEVEMDNEIGYTGLGEANFFQIEPTALLEVNLHKHIRFNIGAGYRFVGKMKYRNFNQSDISSLTGCIGLKFGLFR